ncbi:DUF4907 domain-containing protein [Siphonobacter sp. SORGH_AS_0500]|uniref:DUF4907 domain-containing protein n=1 Tax=Siphonobacter sp. SORGH_AS_0500 TaxID=1864824 RepID=UPI000CB5340F|nr:DUF4907 domain-containing protein [Siphonobacter sp. SORGH_AS_0500]MDR6194345.1 hypothetical protein [Siphonobacter sp. SORGH_AS_0500]PKK37647.1 hypothetical protein BWI96_04035 [Siphonobacter sp. SORGH_AS_0500]
MFRKRWVWFLFIIGLVAVSFYFWKSRSSSYEVSVFKTDIGWGYQISNQGKPYIRQPMIPGIDGEKGFKDAEQAEAAGKLVLHKIENQEFPPSLTVEELKELGVEIP